MYVDSDKAAISPSQRYQRVAKVVGSALSIAASWGFEEVRNTGSDLGSLVC